MVNVPLDVAVIVRDVFLPSNPRRMRKPHPEVLKAAEQFIAAVNAMERNGKQKFTPSSDETTGKLERVLKAARDLLEVLPVPNDYYGDEWAALDEALGDSPENG